MGTCCSSKQTPPASPKPGVNTLTCTSCGKSLKVQLTGTGRQRFNCPKCGATNEIAGEKPAENVGASAEASPQKEPRRTSEHSATSSRGAKDVNSSNTDNNGETKNVSMKCGHCAKTLNVQVSGSGRHTALCPKCGSMNEITLGQGNRNASAINIPTPPWWKGDPPEHGKPRRELVDPEVRAAVQELMDATWKDKTTRDRGFKKVARFEVVNVLQNKNRSSWNTYVLTKEKIRSAQVDQMRAKTDCEEHPLHECFGFLDQRINEFLLFHGTQPSAANNICKEGFLISKSGANTGMLYGPGIYLAESSSKGDEYAEDDADGPYQGLYAMLICRAVCGNLLVNEQQAPNGQALREACTSIDRQYHSVLGDREKIRGTYREFVVYDSSQVYPEYIVIYRRTKAES